MWKKASFALLLAVVASWSPSSTLAQNAAAKDVLITLPVNVDGSAKDLQLLRGETYEDAAISFARVHGLLNQDDARVRQVVDQLSSMLRGRMEELQAKEATKSPPPTVQVMYPLTVNGETREFKKYVGESVHEAVERFLIEGSYTTDLMRELYPQLTNLLNQRLEEIQPARKQLFEFRLILDGREVVARHFEGGDPVEEARETAASVGVTDPQIIGQIANEIRKQIPPPAPEAAPQQPQVAQQQQQQQQPPLKEVFSMPLTMNDRPTVLVHYDGYTSRESAAAYLAAQGVAEDPRVMEQLISIIDNRVAELARQRAEEEAAQAQAAEEQRRQLEAQQQAAAEEAARSQRQPIVQLPINFGDNQVATLQYFEGDSIERTAELFLSRVIGLEEGPAFAQNAAQLSQAIRAKLQSVLEERVATQQQQQPPQPETPPQQPLVTLPVNLSGRVFDLVYYPGEQPATVANNFCVEKHETIRAELGLQFDGDQLLECKNLLENTLRNMIAAKEQELAQQQQQQQQEAPQQAAPVEQQTPPQRQRGAHLLSLDIDVNGVNQPLNVHEGDNIEQVVAEFLSLHRAGPEYAETLIKAINEQLASLQK